jgi:hypothetical protein
MYVEHLAHHRRELRVKLVDPPFHSLAAIAAATTTRLAPAAGLSAPVSRARVHHRRVLEGSALDTVLARLHLESTARAADSDSSEDTASSTSSSASSDEGSDDDEEPEPEPEPEAPRAAAGVRVKRARVQA